MAAPLAAPPKIKPGLLGWFGGAVSVFAVAAIGAVLYFFDPAKHHFFPICQFHQLTGWNCPGCGATRGLYALVHGQVLTAWRDNALLLMCLALAPLRAGWVWWRQRQGVVVRFFPNAWLWPALVIALVFGILRNLPAFSFLSPA